MTTKRKFIAGLVLALVVGLAAGLAWRAGWLDAGEGNLLPLIQDRQELVEIFNKAKAREKEIGQDPDKPESYINLGLDWKSIGELSEQEVFFQKSLAVYEAGIKRFGEKNILFYLNAGKVAERLRDYAKAEAYYKKAIEISSADENGYLYLVDLYGYKMKKSKEDILEVFAEGEKNMVSAIPLIAGRAAYLRRVGDYRAALEDYKVLSQNYPNNQGYKNVIQELEDRLGNAK